MMAPGPNPPPSTQLCRTQALAHVGEYAQAMHALAPSILATPLSKTIVVLHHLHPLVEVDLPCFVNNFHPKMDLALDKKAFIFALTHSPCLSSNGFSGMVYELLWDSFVHEDFVSGFDYFFEICKHIVHGHVPPSVSCLFVALQLLVLEKQAGGFQPIAIAKVIYWLITRTLVIQFKDTFVEHFSPH